MIRKDGNLPFAACVALVLAGLSFRFGGYPLLDPDEGRNAEVGREMAEHNDYVLPRLDGLPYVDKPVVFFAAEALAIRIVGPTPGAARLPALCFTLATVALVWWFGGRRFGGAAGKMAAVATGTSPLTLGFAHTAIMDSTLTFFVVLALVAFYEASEGTGGRLDGQIVSPGDDPTAQPSNRPTAPGEGGGAEAWTALAWGAMALGVLTKGPVALAVPLMVAVPYAAWRKQGRFLIDPVAGFLFLAIVLPWVRAVSQQVPGYLSYVFTTETFERLTTPALRRTGPWWYFVPILLAGTLPWSVLALTGRRRGTAEGRKDPGLVFLILWIIVPLVFFSLSQSKRPQYILPLIPAVGLIVGRIGGWAYRWTDRATSDRTAAAGAVTLSVIGLSLLLGYRLVPSLIQGATPAILAAIPGTAVPLGAVCVISGALAWLLRGRWEVALLALGLPAASIPLASGRLMDAVGAERSALGLARGLEPALTSQTEVVAVRVFPLSLPFYLHRIVVLSTDTGNEITSNYLVRHLDRWREVPDSPLRTGDWWREAVVQCDRPRVFVIRSSDSEAREFLASRLSLLAETSKYAAYGPCGRTDLADGWMDGWTDRRLGGATNGPFPKPTARPSAHPPIRPPA